MIFAIVGRLVRSALAKFGIHLPQRRRSVVERIWDARKKDSGARRRGDQPNQRE